MVAAGGGIGALVWEAFKVGALSYGGGFVIIPLMQHDAVTPTTGWSSAHFLNAVALGQITPGPVVATVAAVGYAAHGVVGGVIAAIVAFTPSFVAVMVGGPRFQQIRGSARAQAFLDGAGPAAIGAILGSAVPLAGALRHGWQIPVLACAAVALLLARRGVVQTLLAAGVVARSSCSPARRRDQRAASGSGAVTNSAGSGSQKGHFGAISRRYRQKIPFSKGPNRFEKVSQSAPRPHGGRPPEPQRR